MFFRHERDVILNWLKFGRTFSLVSSRVLVRWKSSGLRILFFGTDNFSLPSLRKLNEERHKNDAIQSVDVVTSFKKPKNAVLKYSEANSLTIHKWPLELKAPNTFNLGVVVSFGHLIPEKIISLCSKGIINVHASLLPRWRGAAPIMYALKHGDRKTGVTIMKIEPNHFDVGNILAQKEVDIRDDMLLPELYVKMAEEGANLLVSTVLQYDNLIKEAKDQDHSQATYAPKITPEICDVNWNQMTALQVYNLYRALYSYKPLTTKWQMQPVKLIEIRKSDHLNVKYKAGYVEYNRAGKSIRVFCRDGTYIEVLKICVDGGKTITATDFNNGFLNNCPMGRRYFVHNGEYTEPVKSLKHNLTI